MGLGKRGASLAPLTFTANYYIDASLAIIKRIAPEECHILASQTNHPIAKEAENMLDTVEKEIKIKAKKDEEERQQNIAKEKERQKRIAEMISKMRTTTSSSNSYRSRKYSTGHNRSLQDLSTREKNFIWGMHNKNADGTPQKWE